MFCHHKELHDAVEKSPQNNQIILTTTHRYNYFSLYSSLRLFPHWRSLQVSASAKDFICKMLLYVQSNQNMMQAASSKNKQRYENIFQSQMYYTKEYQQQHHKKAVWVRRKVVVIVVDDVFRHLPSILTTVFNSCQTVLIFTECKSDDNPTHSNSQQYFRRKWKCFCQIIQFIIMWWLLSTFCNPLKMFYSCFTR